MTFTIEEHAPGMNVLMRMHFRTYGKLRDKWQVLLREAVGTYRFRGKVDVRIIRFYAGVPMDLDNLWSTCKIPLDAMVRSGILPSDNPECVSALRCEQFKIPTKNRERTEITILEL